jgi:hypothetical protein
MPHEFNSLWPFAVTEKGNGLIILLGKIESKVSANPFRRAIYTAPAHKCVSIELLNLHNHFAFDVAIRRSKGEFYLSPNLLLTFRLLSPPIRQAFYR